MTTVTVILNFIIRYFYDVLLSHENVECKIYGSRVVVISLFPWYYQRYAHAVR